MPKKLRRPKVTTANVGSTLDDMTNGYLKRVQTMQANQVVNPENITKPNPKATAKRRNKGTGSSKNNWNSSALETDRFNRWLGDTSNSELFPEWEAKNKLSSLYGDATPINDNLANISKDEVVEAFNLKRESNRQAKKSEAIVKNNTQEQVQSQMDTIFNSFDKGIDNGLYNSIDDMEKEFASLIDAGHLTQEQADAMKGKFKFNTETPNPSAVNNAVNPEDIAPNGSANKVAQEVVEDAGESAKYKLKGTLKKYGFTTALNTVFTVADYKEQRRSGKSVGSSVASAGTNFALGELLGMKYMGYMAAKALPKAAIGAVEGIYSMNRKQNSMSRFQTFGDIEFQDTQQMATMRQSGMEMAKMSQYNLQQTLMGNEAQYMHR